MASIFVSYSRKSESTTVDIVRALHAIGHSVWVDQELSGGQIWWDEILKNIRDRDVFVCVIDQNWLDSPACQSEYGYARALSKSVLPILLSESVTVNRLPRELARLQLVDWRARENAQGLTRALNRLPTDRRLPEPLPLPPEVPMPYLGDLGEKVGSAALNFDEQIALMFRLGREMRDAGTAVDARALLA
jgi:hypothetical protein